MTRASQLRLLVLAVLLVTLSTLPVFLVGAAFFQIGPELSIGPLGLGALTAAFFFTSAAVSTRLGKWVERVGWQKAMRLNVIGSALLATLIAPLARDVWSLATLLVAGAVVYGISNPAANQALALHTNPHRLATVFGIKHAGIPSSTLLAGLAVPAVVIDLGWRSAFFIAPLLAVVVWALIPRQVPEPVPMEGPMRDSDRLSGSDLRRLAVVAALGAVAAGALGTFLVSASVEAGIDEAAAGWLQFVGSGASIGARLLIGMAVDRRGGGRRALFSLLAAGAVAFAVLPWAVGAWFVIVTIIAYATGWGWPGLMTATVVGSDRSAAASRSAITQAGVFVGAAGGPLVLGAVAEQLSFDPMWLLVAVGLVFAVGLSAPVLLQRRVRPA